MSNILSYSDNVTGSDWIRRDPYTTDDITRITDPNGGLVEHPRTAIPSPFAQLDLVSNAFARLASGRLQGLQMDRRLVSDALDIAQILFDMENHAGRISIVRWNPESAISRMERSGADHQLLAETLRLFMESDREAYNFDLSDDWYILTADNIAIGSTSPASLTMGAPGVGERKNIMVEEGETLFGRIRDLWERDEEFVVYLTHWFNAWPELRRKLKPVYNYLLVNLDTARERRPELYAAVCRRVSDPQAMDTARAEGLAALLPGLYSDFTGPFSPRVLGRQLYIRKQEDMLQAVEKSDFMLRPELRQPAGDERLPLVLTPGFVAPGMERFTYVNRPWNENTVVDTAGKPVEERVLPDTSVTYPWITACDLLEDEIIELATPIDRNHFFDACAPQSRSAPGYLLPLKPLFFKYFPAEALCRNVAPGKPMFELRSCAEGVQACLRVPCARSYVELHKIYRAAPAGGEQQGSIVAGARLSAAIFPFARTGKNDIYNVRLFEMMPDAEASLTFHAAESAPGSGEEATMRSRSRAMRTSYYEINRSFDYMRLTLTGTDGRSVRSGVILPLWPDYTPSAAQFTFAVDFGTTNTHVEYSTDGSPAEPLTFSEEAEATLTATLDAPGSLLQSDAMLDLEFIPRSIGGLYGFPLRTSLAENETNASGPRVLRNCNIPFLYERKSFNGYKISTMLKWADRTELSEQFLREIMLLIRARVIVSRGDLSRVRLIYFYPVSMKRSLQLKYLTLWEELYARYISPDRTDIVSFPESVAPAFYYEGTSRDGSDYVSIDIGGGTSDVVVYKADDEQFRSDLHFVSSFRFAGNTIFGDCFRSCDADHNPLVQEYANRFSRLVSADANLSYLDLILGDIMHSKRSEDINAFLFSIEQSEMLRDRPALERRALSYNAMLADDEQRKIIFVYFYSAIIYYVGRLMKENGLGMPRQICFSGTGSKILSILGRPETVEDYTRRFIELVYGRSYGSATFRVRRELTAPKQITCKGGIELDRRIEEGKISRAGFSSREVMGRKRSFTLTDTESYTYGSIRPLAERNKIIAAVKEFNTLFIKALDPETREEFGIPSQALDFFRAHCSENLSNYLAAGIDAYLPEDEGSDEKVEDVPFFYPIAATIRNTLLPGLQGSPGRRT